MASEDERPSWLERRLGRIKDNVKWKRKQEPSQTRSRIVYPGPEDISVPHPNTSRNHSAGHPSPSTEAAGSLSNVPTGSLGALSENTNHERAVSSEFSRNTPHHTSDDNYESPYTWTPGHRAPPESDGVVAEETAGNKEGPYSKRLLGPNQLWTEAYRKLENDDPGILRAYERVLLEEGHPGQTCMLDDNEPQTGNANWQRQVQDLARERLKETQEKWFSFRAGGKNIIVREQVQKVIGFVVSTKDLVSAAISSDPQAALAWAGIMFIFPLLNTMLQQDADAVKGFEDTLRLLVRCALIEEDFLQPRTKDLNPSGNEYKLILSLQSNMVDLYSNVYVYQIRVVLHFRHPTALRYLGDLVVSDDWKGMAQKIKATEIEIGISSQSLSNHTVVEIDRKLECFQSNLDSTKVAEQDSYLRELRPAHSAMFNHSEIEGEARCTPGTRLEILNTIQRWMGSSTGKPILWLHGMAGTGKSTIARTVARALSKRTPFADGAQLPSNISLGATFFFKQDDTERNRAGALFTTFAHQLAYKPLGLGSGIVDVIKQQASPPIRNQSLETQWEELILKPLQMLQGESPPCILIFIIDALDECRDKETRIMKMNAQHIVQSLQQVQRLSKVQIRVLITSRNESHIDTAFKNLPEKSYDKIELTKVSLSRRNDEEKDDITKFLESELPVFKTSNGVVSQWLTADDFRKLAEKAGGLFIYAATSCKFLDVKPHIAKKRLDKLLQGNSHEKSPEAVLDQIYGTVLDSYGRDLTDDEKQEDDLLKEILGLIVVSFRPLSMNSLAEFTELRISAFEVKECLDGLRSVIDLPEDINSPVGLVHLSFHEFLLDGQRSQRTGFHVQPSTVHFTLFERCLEIMSYSLKMDICNLQKPGALSVEVPSDLIQRCIPSHLQYACRYWVDHIQEIGKTSQVEESLADDGSIHKFLKKHILNWLEVLSLIGEVGSAFHMVSHLENLIDTQNNPRLRELLYDSTRFIRFHIQIIQEYPLQVHYSAILFSPTTSIIRSLPISEPLFEWATILPNVNNTWGPELVALEGHKDCICGVAISPDSKMIVSGSEDNTIRLWEAATGIELRVWTTNIETENYWAVTLAFSSDGQIIASSTTGSIPRLYDVGTGETSDLTDDDSGEYTGGAKGRSAVRDLAFSPHPDSKLLASIATDSTFRLWDVSKKQQILMHKVLEGSARTVAFTHNAILIASILEPGTVRICGINTEPFTAEYHLNHSISTLQSYTDDIGPIAFSPNGATAALVTHDKLLQVWDIESRAMLIDSSLHMGADCVAFSSDGDILAIGFLDGTISIWNLESGKEIRKLRIHSNSITSIAVSPNGSFIVSASNDSTIRICDATARDETEIIDEERIYKVLIPYGSDAGVVNYANKIAVWDLNNLRKNPRVYLISGGGLREYSPNGKIAVLFEGEYGPIQTYDLTTGMKSLHLQESRFLAFSPDSQLLAVASRDAIQILEVGTWKERSRFKTKTLDDARDFQFSIGNRIFWESRPSGLDESVSYVNLGNLETGIIFYEERLEHSFLRSKISPDGSLVAFQPKHNETYVDIIRVDTQEVRASIQVAGGIFPSDILFSPDSTCIGAMANSESGGMITLTTLGDTATTDIVYTLPKNIFSDVVAIGNDGKVAGVKRGDGVFIWDPVTNKVSGRLVRSHWPKLSFSEDGRYLYSSHGRLPLPSTTRDLSCLYVDGDWVLQGGEKLLWLPQAYRPESESIAVRGGTIVLGLDSGSAVFIEIDLERTPLAKHYRAFP